MSKVNGSDIAVEIAEEMGLSKAAAKTYMDIAFRLIREHVERGDEVNISRFGKFKMGVTAPRKGRNMYTKEVIDIPAKHKIMFDMSRQLQQGYNENTNVNDDGEAVIDIRDDEGKDGEQE